MIDTKGLTLPTNPGPWQRIIIEQLTDASPELGRSAMAIEVIDIDQTKGNLTGAVIAANGQVIVPVTVRNFRLKPLDIIVYDGMVKVLSDRTVKDVLFSPQIMNSKSVNPHNLQLRTDISHLLHPPLESSSGYGGYGATAGFPLIDNKSACVGALKVASDATKTAMTNMLINNRSILAACATMMPFDAMMTELKKEGFETKEKIVAAGGNGGTLYLKSAGDNSYTVNNRFKVAIDSDVSHQILNLLGEHEKSAFLLTGEALHEGLSGVNTNITILNKTGYSVLCKRSFATVAYKDGTVSSGIIFPRVIRYDGNSCLNGFFIDKEHNWAYQENILGRSEGDTFFGQDMPGFLAEIQELSSVPKIGDTGCFIRDTGDAALEPFTIVSLYNAGGTSVMSVHTKSGQRLVIDHDNSMSISSDAYIEELTGRKISNAYPFVSRRVYKIGGGYKYISLRERKGAFSHPEDITSNIIRRMDDDGDHTIICISKRGNEYTLKGSGPNKGGMSKLGCRYSLIEAGLSPKQAETMINITPVSFTIKTTGKSASDIQTNQETAPLYTGTLSNNNPDGGLADNIDIIEQGAKTNNSEVLDNVLALSMASGDENIKKYLASNVMSVHTAIDTLGRMLLAFRFSKKSDYMTTEGIEGLLRSMDKIMWQINDYSKTKPVSSEDSDGQYV